MGNFADIIELKNKGFNKTQIAKRLNLDRKTVRKYCDMDDKAYLEYRNECAERTRIMEPYDAFVMNKLKRYPDCSSAQIYDWLRETYNGFKPSYASVRLHTSRLRAREGITKDIQSRQYQAVQDLPLGHQAQVDMGSDWMCDEYGKRIKVYIFCISMSASRNKYIYFQQRPFNTEDFLNAHDFAFQYFGGRPHEIVYDQDRVLCISENAGDILFTEQFVSYKMYCGFDVWLCRGYDPESKGKIEAVVKYVKNNFLKNRIYKGIESLNTEGLAWLERTGNGLPHNTTKLVPKEAFEEEKKHLLPVPARQETRQAAYVVRKDNVVGYKSNRYAMPLGTYSPGRQVYLSETDGILNFADKKGEIIVTHPVCSQKGKLISISHPERAEMPKHKNLYEDVLSLLNNSEEAKAFLLKNRELYPRYTRDQLFSFKKTAETFSSAELVKALEYCQAHELFSATDFKDALEYFKVQEPEAVFIDQPQIPAKYLSVVAQQRDITDYTIIYGGNK